MIESGDKAQFAGTKAARQRALLEHVGQDSLHRDVRVLGVVPRGKPRSDQEKELERVNLALERILLLGMLRLSTEVVGLGMSARSCVESFWQVVDCD